MRLLSLFLLVLMLAPCTHAAFSPVSLNLVPPLQFPPDDFTITGLRLGLIGKQRDVFGLDFGLIGNVTTGDFGGLAVSGLFNYTGGQTHVVGLQLAGGANVNTNKTTVVGFQIAGGSNYNTAESSIFGVQASIANLSEHTKVYGFELGVYNRAQDVYGFQIGLVNVATNLHGVQLGLLNFNKTGLLAVSPLLNIGF